MTTLTLSSSYQLSLVVVQSDRDTRLTSLVITSLSKLLFTLFVFALWAIREEINRQALEVYELVKAFGELVEAVGMALKVYGVWLGILFKSLAFGMGVRV
ncbi:MAG: hypothetical protein DPW09_00540 [Anaerolineae bacterium]|nr:hypothetical protein [Anaerolineae bacterium]